MNHEGLTRSVRRAQSQQQRATSVGASGGRAQIGGCLREVRLPRVRERERDLEARALRVGRAVAELGHRMRLVALRPPQVGQVDAVDGGGRAANVQVAENDDRPAEHVGKGVRVQPVGEMPRGGGGRGGVRDLRAQLPFGAGGSAQGGDVIGAAF